MRTALDDLDLVHLESSSLENPAHVLDYRSPRYDEAEFRHAVCTTHEPSSLGLVIDNERARVARQRSAKAADADTLYADGDGLEDERHATGEYVEQLCARVNRIHLPSGWTCRSTVFKESNLVGAPILLQLRDRKHLTPGGGTEGERSDCWAAAKGSRLQVRRGDVLGWDLLMYETS